MNYPGVGMETLYRANPKFKVCIHYRGTIVLCKYLKVEGEGLGIQKEVYT